MATFNNVMEIFKLLEKTNCRKCNKPTCLAFAAAVFQGQVPLTDCPFVDESVINKYGSQKQPFESKMEQDYQKRLNQLEEKLIQTDLKSRAEVLGGFFADGKLTIKIFGKNFSVDNLGKISTDIHVNEWITPSVFSYIISSKGLPLTNKWVPFRELKTAVDWHKFFDHQCVKAFKDVADTYTNFFEDIIKLLNGKQVDDHYDADISLIIYPLPKVPMLICYNKPEHDFGSDLNLFFDSTADKNLPAEELYTLGTGLARMFKKLAQNHG